MTDLHEIMVEIKLDERFKKTTEKLDQMSKSIGSAGAEAMSSLGERLMSIALPLSMMNSAFATQHMEREADEHRRQLAHESIVMYLNSLSSPERHPWESLFAWGERLSEAGYLDRPHIRWMYQKAVLQAVFMPWRKR